MDSTHGSDGPERTFTTWQRRHQPWWHMSNHPLSEGKRWNGAAKTPWHHRWYPGSKAHTEQQRLRAPGPTSSPEGKKMISLCNNQCIDSYSKGLDLPLKLTFESKWLAYLRTFIEFLFKSRVNEMVAQLWPSFAGEESPLHILVNNPLTCDASCVQINACVVCI